LIATGAGLAVTSTLAAGHRVRVLAIGQPVAAGDIITDADLATARVASDPHLAPISASRRTSVVGMHAAVDLRPGTLLTQADLTSEAIPGPGQAIVGAALKPGQLPALPLARGDQVLVTGTPGPAYRAAVVDVTTPGSDGSVVVDLAVPNTVAAPLVSELASGHVALVLLPRAGA
jgi:hypothetical protein